jgi:FkbM family methyltransferase
MHLTNNIDDTYITHIFNEVIRGDTYGLKHDGNSYDVIYDIGANVGMFSLFASVMFPEAKIIAVEPDEKNFEYVEMLSKFNTNITPVRAALGSGPTYEFTDTPPGNRVWRCNQMGYPDGWTESHPQFKKSSVPSMTLHQLWKQFGGSKPFVKIDTEGAEHSLIGDTDSEGVLSGSLRIAMEIHYFAANEEAKVPLLTKPREWLLGFSATHDVRFLSEWDCGAVVDMRKR